MKAISFFKRSKAATLAPFSQQPNSNCCQFSGWKEGMMQKDGPYTSSPVAQAAGAIAAGQSRTETGATPQKLPGSAPENVRTGIAGCWRSRKEEKGERSFRTAALVLMMRWGREQMRCDRVPCTLVVQGGAI
ncbi:hypothetical protein SAY86_007618 [Trapa natans]|uniref:Uncharacterized protein n=1 Tax=Trapa natans TaxID=22666 RepID=A0AAN7QX55_TRANT|nr:hypothetical protein SAY86_007618 [Trapa natans]